MEELGSGIVLGLVKGGNSMLPLETLPKQLPAVGSWNFPFRRDHCLTQAVVE